MVGKSELTARVAQRTGMPKSQAAKAVNAVVDTISEALAKQEGVSLTGFGSWRVTETKARQGRNPRTGQTINIAAGRRVSFRPGSTLASGVRGGGSSGGGRGGARSGGGRGR
ncbi:MAG TPA: HU family DNA-binding protein [Chloroflexota bacterium]|nr:HU family DNA-binding protein [Chloroflexota bacterium]